MVGLHEQLEEEEQGGMFYRYILGLADDAVGVVTDGTVVVDFPQCEVVLATYGAIAFYLP